jgi:peroxiredoxin Q/BCP
MVSLDDAEKNKAFAESEGARFVLLSDPGKENARAYDVLGSGGLWTKRVTFYIGSGGVLRYIDDDVDTATHGEDIVRKLGELGIGRSGE